MDSIWSSFSKWFNEKTASPLYFTYIGFFIVWNWRFFQVVFFANPSLFTQPKIEYISSHFFFSIFNNLNLPIWLIAAMNSIFNTAWHVIPPAILTVLAILYLPIIQKWALSKHLIAFYERKRMFVEKEREHANWLLKSEKNQKETLEKIAEIKKEQNEQKQIIEWATDPEEKWQNEYENIKKSSLFSEFQSIIDAVYSDGGRTHKVINGRWQKVIRPEILAFADTKELITINGVNQEERISLTEKGKFVILKYLEDFKQNN